MNEFGPIDEPTVNVRDLERERISPTGAYVAAMKWFAARSGALPWSGEVAKASGASAQFEQWRTEAKVEGYPRLFSRGMAARHLMIDQVLRERKIKNILDIGAGLPTRGLTFTENDDTNYVGMDFPVVVAQDKAILRELDKTHAGVATRPNLKYREGNLTDADSLLAGMHELPDDGPVGVVTEGVLSYLDLEQLRIAAQNIAAIMRSRPGSMWITDMVTRDSIGAFRGVAHGMGDTASIQMLDKFEEIIGQRIDDAPLANEVEARAFFEGQGFRVELVSHETITDQLDHERLGIDRNVTADAMRRRPLWVLHIAEKSTS
jgi:O-methyltransferase involved in polyketide biosynthesis